MPAGVPNMFNANCPINPSTPPKAKAAPGAANFEIPEDGINLFTSAVAIMPPPTPSATFCKVLDPVIDFNDVFTLVRLLPPLLVFLLTTVLILVTIFVLVLVFVLGEDFLPLALAILPNLLSFALFFYVASFLASHINYKE